MLLIVGGRISLTLTLLLTTAPIQLLGAGPTGVNEKLTFSFAGHERPRVVFTAFAPYETPVPEPRMPVDPVATQLKVPPIPAVSVTLKLIALPGQIFPIGAAETLTTGKLQAPGTVTTAVEIGLFTVGSVAQEHLVSIVCDGPV